MSDHRRPNILLIVADQLVASLTGAYGHEVVKTPNLDRLAAEGVRFDAAYSPCPVCAPARAAMMTGKYVSTIGAWDNAAPFSCDEPTIAHYLSAVGYDTVLSGKIHYVGADQLHGFRRRFTTNIYPAEFDWVPVRDAEHPLSRTHAENYIGEGVHVGRWSQFLSGDEETQLRAKEYLRAQGIARARESTGGEADSPFFCCVSYHHPHEPFWPTQELWDLYEDEEIELPELPENLDETYSMLDRWLNTYHGVARAGHVTDPESLQRVRRAYYALVTYVDRKVGELLDVLHANALEENTIVIFTSDHGDMLGERGMVQKRAFYEWSSRVPLIFRFPDRAHAGRRVAAPVNLIDLLPTLQEIASVEPERRLPCDGRSLVPLFEHEEERISFSEYHSQGSHAPCFMARRGAFKYTYIHGYEAQLFDLDKDPGEWENLSGRPETREVEQELHSALLARFDPERIDREIDASIERRKLVDDAMKRNGTRWDYEPRFDPARSLIDQYLARAVPREGRRAARSHGDR